ncbi:TspO/MBR family protein [Metabacillus fastidiosus]|uniref:TspO/MBR family protein n=1 Tax=Metabacillus fastidiosus TaxID=1458 RepID=UPI003D26E724
MNILEVNGKIDFKKLSMSMLIPIAGGAAVGLLANRNSQKQYKKLKQPSFAPPAWVFPVVWTGLYATMGIARYRALAKAEKGEKRKAAIPYDIQLGLNFLWSFLFFKWGLRGTAFIEIALLFSMITLTTYQFSQIDKTAGVLMLPYIGWVAFALGLNYSIWQLNK